MKSLCLSLFFVLFGSCASVYGVEYRNDVASSIGVNNGGPWGIRANLAA